MPSDRVRDSLNELIQAASESNPLEVLGVNQDLARELGPEALLVAVKGLYRAHQFQLHPDRASGAKTRQGINNRLQRLQEAYEAIDGESVEEYRKRLLAKKPKSSRKSAVTPRKEEYNYTGRVKASEYIEAIHAPESVLNIKSASLIVRPFSVLPQDNNLPLLELNISEDTLTSTKLQLISDVDMPDDLEPESDKTVQVFKEDSEESKWYVVRGNQENRSVQLIQPISGPENIDGLVVGVIDQEVAKSELNKYFASTDTMASKRDALIAGSSQMKVPARFAERFRINNGWAHFTVGDKNDQILYPKLEEGKILVVRQDKDLIVVGRIEYTKIEYKS